MSGNRIWVVGWIAEDQFMDDVMQPAAAFFSLDAAQSWLDRVQEAWKQMPRPMSDDEYAAYWDGDRESVVQFMRDWFGYESWSHEDELDMMDYPLNIGIKSVIAPHVDVTNMEETGS